jgi:DNA-directed RNA polymerase subunit RPC12/RpoP
MEKPKQIIVSFLCPNCGAEVDTIEGYTNVCCKYCGGKLLITQRVGLPRVFARPKLKNPEAIIKSDAGPKVRIIDLDLLFIPLIKFRAEILGWIYAHKKGEVKKGYYHPAFGETEEDSYSIGTEIVGKKTIKKRVRRILEDKIDPSDFYRFGVKRIKIEGKKYEPYDDELLHRFGNVFDLPLSLEEYLGEGQAILLSKVLSHYSNWDELKYVLKIIKKEATIYYYPVYFSRLEVDGIPYTYSVDAVTGEILLKEGLVKKEGKRTLKVNPLYSIITFSAIAVSLIYKFFGKVGTVIACLAILFLIWELQFGTE